ncbi:MAG TPA: HAMP domain-containing sensor histidine kinase [Solirubrobacteraceae bacterium]|jgi:signal transduction histidine kinase
MTGWLGSRFGLRERIWATVVGSIAVVVVALTWGFNVLVSSRLQHEASTVAIARATAELDALRVSPAGIQLTETLDAGALDTPTWVFRGTRALEQPRASAIDRAHAAALARASRGFHDVDQTDTRLYGLPVISGGQRLGTVVAAVALEPYEGIRRVALIGSSALALLALVAVAVASRWLISRALRPVAHMTQQAADWSEHDLERRFALGDPRDEFTRLAATLDGLLDRVAASLRHEQDLTAELSHELRTPLTQISTEAQYALRHACGSEDAQAGYQRILASARQMARILDTLISAARARSAPHSSSDAQSGARAAIQGCEPLASRSEVQIVLDAPAERIVAGVDAMLLERVLSPLLENACRYAHTKVTLGVATEDSTVRFDVQDDGPGIREADFENVFKPGYRGDSADPGAQAGHGAGLGLAVARRLARGVGGNVRVAESASGARFVVTLPHA